MTEYYNFNMSAERPRAALRWFGPNDPVTINMIRQASGITNVVSALHHIPPGEIWTEKEIAKRKIEVEFLPNTKTPKKLTGLELYRWHERYSERTGRCWDTAESLVFTEDIKNGGALRNLHIENYKRSLENLGKFGVVNVIGNFMLMADWTRTGTTKQFDGSVALYYDHGEFTAFDRYMLIRHPGDKGYINDGSYTPHELKVAGKIWKTRLRDNFKRQQKLKTMVIKGLPGAQQGFDLEDFRLGVKKYEGMSVEQLRENISYFLSQVVPVAQSNGVKLCSHPDDPAFSPFMGTPRAVGTVEGYKFLLAHRCGVNLCPGSMLPNEENRNFPKVIRELAEYGLSLGMNIDEIFPHVHLRPIVTVGKSFIEGHHAEHREELELIVHTLVNLGWKGTYRPDHAPTPDHGIGNPGYCGIGRANGASVLIGLFQAARSEHVRLPGAIRAAFMASGQPMTSFDSAMQAAVKAQATEIESTIPRKKVSPYRGGIGNELYEQLAEQIPT